MNPFKFNDHLNLIRILKSDKYIKNKLITINYQNQRVKEIDDFIIKLVF